MSFITLLSWLFTVGLGGFMLRTWLARGGLKQVKDKDGGLPPKLIFGHAVLAVVGLLLWIGYVASGARPLAWVAVILLMLTVALGLSTVTLWTPYPAKRPGERRVPDRWDVPAVVVPDTVAAVVDAQVPEPQVADVQGPDGQGADGQGADGQEAREPDGYQVTDEMIARLLEDPLPKRQPPVRTNMEFLVPVAHGFAALTTFLLALMSAIS